MAATFQNLSGGRLLLNVVTGGETHEQRAYGDFLDKDARYARVRRVPRRSSAGCGPARRSTFAGRAPAGREARAAAAARPGPGDLLRRLLAGRRPGRRQARRRLPHLGRAAGRRGGEDRLDPRARRRARAARSRFGIRMHTITRDTSEEAWAEADRLLEGIDDADDPPACRTGLKRQRVRGPATHARPATAAARDGLEIHPNVWAGVGLVRGGAGTALVGSHEEVADRIEEYAALGIEEFVLSGLPAPRGRLLVRRGRAADPGEARPVDQPGPGRRAARRCRSAASGPRHEQPRVAVVVGNPKPRSRTLRVRADPRRPAGRRRPRRRPRRPRARSSSTGARPRVTELVEEVASSRRGGRRQPDLQGDLHRAAQGVPRPLPAPGARRRDRGPADARRVAGPRARPRARAAARCSSSWARPCRPAGSTSSTPSTTGPTTYDAWLATAQQLLPTLPAPAPSLEVSSA